MQPGPKELIAIAVSGTEAAVYKGSIFPGFSGHERRVCRGDAAAVFRLCGSCVREKKQCCGKSRNNCGSGTIAANGCCSSYCDTRLPFFPLALPLEAWPLDRAKRLPNPSAW